MSEVTNANIMNDMTSYDLLTSDDDVSYLIFVVCSAASASAVYLLCNGKSYTKQPRKTRPVKFLGSGIQKPNYHATAWNYLHDQGSKTDFLVATGVPRSMFFEETTCIVRADAP